MFDSLSDRLQGVFRKISGHGKLSEANIADTMKEIRLALLEADVNYKVVKNFIAGVKEKSLGQEVLRSIKPSQQIVKIVHDERVELMGSENAGLILSGQPAIIMLVGLQGAGKTTAAAKLAAQLRKKGRNPLMAACDVKRPAAIEQLKTLGRQLKIEVFSSDGEQNVVKIAAAAVEHSRKNHFDTLILDTAGRLHIDDELMGELEGIKTSLSPDEILLVADSMTGQDAVNIAEKFNELLDISGVLLTKLDGDTRGGAALSIRAVTGKPIKYAGIGEKISDLEPFYPDRLASRILGMGDVVTLVERAQDMVSEDDARKLEEKIRKHKLNLEDYLQQLQQIKSMGSLESIMSMLPGMGNMKNMAVDEKQLFRTEAIINSMTPGERRNPEVLNGSRRQRIAKGSGTTVQDVNRMLKGFDMAKKMMKNMGKMQKGMMKRIGGF